MTGIDEALELTHDDASTNGSDRHALPNVGAHERWSLAILGAPRPFSACRAPYCDWIARREGLFEPVIKPLLLPAGALHIAILCKMTFTR